MKFKYILIIVLFLYTNMFSQWNFSLSTEQGYSDNPFNSPLPVSTFISSFDVGIEKSFSSLNIGFYGDYTTFHEMPERNFYWYQAGFWSGSDTNIFGLYMEQRMNSHDYELYNYSNYNTYYKHKFSYEGINLLANVSLSYTDYSNLEHLDNLLLNSGFLLNKNFETKTTLIAGLSFNYKDYVSTELNNTNLVGDSLHSSSDNAFTNQLVINLKAAQSLAESTGIALQYTNQNITGGTANYIRKLDYIYGDESQFFDDPISYEGQTYSAQLTQLLPSEIMLKFILSYSDKNYPSQGVYIDSENFNDSLIRSDKRSRIDFIFQKYFMVGNENQNMINLTLTYSWIKNESNSFWYNYKSNYLNLSIDYQF